MPSSRRVYLPLALSNDDQVFSPDIIGFNAPFFPSFNLLFYDPKAPLCITCLN